MASDADPEIQAGEQALSALDYPEAYKHFDKAAKADPKNPVAWFGKAEAALGLPKMEADDILACYKKAVELEPEHPQFLEALASFSMDLGRFNEAEQFYNKAADVDREIAIHLWRMEMQPVIVDDVDIGLVAGREESAIPQAH